MAVLSSTRVRRARITLLTKSYETYLAGPHIHFAECIASDHPAEAVANAVVEPNCDRSVCRAVRRVVERAVRFHAARIIEAISNELLEAFVIAHQRRQTGDLTLAL